MCFNLESSSPSNLAYTAAPITITNTRGCALPKAQTPSMHQMHPQLQEVSNLMLHPTANPHHQHSPGNRRHLSNKAHPTPSRSHNSITTTPVINPRGQQPPQLHTDQPPNNSRDLGCHHRPCRGVIRRATCLLELKPALALRSQTPLAQHTDLRMHTHHTRYPLPDCHTHTHRTSHSLIDHQVHISSSIHHTDRLTHSSNGHLNTIQQQEGLTTLLRSTRGDKHQKAHLMGTLLLR